MNRRWWLLPLGCLCLVYGSVAAAASWHAVDSASHLNFSATYEGDQAPGVFHVFHTTLSFDPARPQQGHLQVRVDLATADMHSSDINATIRGPVWLAAAGERWAEFDSTAIRAAGPHTYIATGTLLLKGTRHTVQVPFSWNELGDTAVLEGSTSVKRTVFNVGSGQWAQPDQIGLTIRVRYHVVFRKAP